jgi:hypothetical protein
MDFGRIPMFWNGAQRYVNLWYGCKCANKALGIRTRGAAERYGASGIN